MATDGFNNNTNIEDRNNRRTSSKESEEEEREKSSKGEDEEEREKREEKDKGDGKEKKGEEKGDAKNQKEIDEEQVWKDIIGEEVSWDSMSTKEKTLRIAKNTALTTMVFVFLYFFICSLELLSSAFSLISGKSTGALVNNDYISNPIVGLMIGILLTVLVQSSSTSTSIIVSLVATGMLTVDIAIPIIMGSNIGTSVTNTIVSMTQVTNKENFRRAFSGATVHDMFNWLSVLVLLPIEVIFGVLEKLTTDIVDNMAGKDGVKVEFLETITSPFTELIIQLDSVIVNCWGLGYRLDEDSMIKEYCDKVAINETFSTTQFPSSPFAFTEVSDVTEYFGSTDATEYSGSTDVSEFFGSTDVTWYYSSSEDPVPIICQTDDSVVGIKNCKFLFYDTNMDDTVIGVLLLCIALFILIASLICVVRILNTLLKGSIAKIIKKVINSDVPYVPWITGYIAIIIGAIMTFIVQSSSVFTSTITPLIGLGIITVERAYPLTLGSNIGTTTTALLASMAVTGERTDAVQIALVHLFFNIFGIMLFYPLPFMRFPIPMCKALGNVTADHRWFAIFYLVSCFFVLPASIFALSLGGPAVLWGVLVPVVVFILVIVLINILQTRRPQLLPQMLRSWEFLPLPLHSLEPYDRVFLGLPFCKKCRQDPDEENPENLEFPVDEQARKRIRLTTLNSEVSSVF